MLHSSEKNRSVFCHLITDFHSIKQRRAARFDMWGVLASVQLAAGLVELIRLLVSR